MTIALTPPAGAPARPSRTALTRGAWLLLAWTIFGLLSSTHFFFQAEAGGEDATFAGQASHVMVFYWAWALMTPVVLLVARRVTRDRTRGWRAWTVPVVAAPAVMFAHGVLFLGTLRLTRIVPGLHVDAAHLRQYLMLHGGGDVATYLVLLGVYLLVDAYRRARDRELAAAALEARLATADLELLRWQLQPHFLFNVLNTVSTLVLKNEGQAAERALSLISGYLRTALDQRADAMVTLVDELALVRRYLEIEALRFGDGLRLETLVPDETRLVRVPAMIVQPLVENALRHGVAGRTGAAPIRIEARLERGRLVLTVTDPGGDSGSGGGGGAGADVRADGFGLRYVRERLRLFYGTRAGVVLSLSPTGAVATLTLPLSGEPGVAPDAFAGPGEAPR